METIVCHFWIAGMDGKSTLYEQDDLRYPIRDGVICLVKVFNSERPCRCRERRLAASMS